MTLSNTKRSPKVLNNKKNAYEGELSLVANQVKKKKKKKSYAVQKMVVMGVRGWKETAI